MTDAPHQGHRERIRSRYIKEGAEGFADYQLLELLLSYAIPRRDTNGVAHALMDRFGSLSKVFSAEVEQLTRVEGIGESAAVFLRLQRDVYLRQCAGKLQNRAGKTALTSPLLAARYALLAMDGYDYETVLAISLNSRREVLYRDVLQTGSLTEAQIYPRAAAETALLRRAHSLLLLHNHPSGNPTPSSEDGEATQAVRAALASIGVQLMDHLIVGTPYVYSFAAGVILDISGETAATVPPEEFAAYRAGLAPALKKVMEGY